MQTCQLNIACYLMRCVIVIFNLLTNEMRFLNSKLSLFKNSVNVIERIITAVLHSIENPDDESLMTESSGSSENSSEMIDLDYFMVVHNGQAKRHQPGGDDQIQPTGDQLTDLLMSVKRRHKVLVDSYESWSSSEQSDRERPARQRRKPRTYKYNPKPVLQKGDRSYVPDALKDREYWERRQRNNEAARKSREERRRKELEVLDKMKGLEKMRSDLESKVCELERRNAYLESRLKKYELNECKR